MHSVFAQKQSASNRVLITCVRFVPQAATHRHGRRNDHIHQQNEVNDLCARRRKNDNTLEKLTKKQNMSEAEEFKKTKQDNEKACMHSRKGTQVSFDSLTQTIATCNISSKRTSSFFPAPPPPVISPFHSYLVHGLLDGTEL